MYTIVSFNQKTIIFFRHFYYLFLTCSVNFYCLRYIKMNIGGRIIELRKQKNWSQTDLANKTNVSRVIIGRYERNEAAPSIEVAKKIADAFGVSLDYLVGEGLNASFDKQTLQLIQDIESLEPSVKEKLIYVANAIIRDSKTKKAYS